VTAAIWPGTSLQPAPSAGIEVPCGWDASGEMLLIAHDQEQAMLADRASGCVQRCGFPGALGWGDPRLYEAVRAYVLEWSFVITHREVIARRVGGETDEADFLAVVRLAVELARAVRARFTAVADAARALHEGHDPVRVIAGGVGNSGPGAGFV